MLQKLQFPPNESLYPTFELDKSSKEYEQAPNKKMSRWKFHRPHIGGTIIKAEQNVSVDIITEQIKNLKGGYLNFICPETMTLNFHTNVVAEISIDKSFLPALDSSKSFDKIKVGKKMSLKLMGIDFEITSKNSETQLILNDRKTNWNWDVKPLKKGIKKIELIITVKLNFEGRDEVYDYPINIKSVLVKVNRAYQVNQFWSKNWQWLISTLIGSGIILVILKILGIIR